MEPLTTDELLELDSNASSKRQCAYQFFKQRSSITKYVYLVWVDYMGTARCRILPVAGFLDLLQTGRRVSLSRANAGSLQDDTPTAACSRVGQFFLNPELASLRVCGPKDPLPSAFVLCSWYDVFGRPLALCPRGMLAKNLHDLEDDRGVTVQLGFKLEVTFLRRTQDADSPFEPITTIHGRGTMSGDQWTNAMPLVAEVVAALEKTGLSVLQFHAGSGPGKYEFALRPKPALHAIDALVQTRHVIYQTAAAHGVRATMHPLPIPGGTAGLHAHISLNEETTDGIEARTDNFFEGVLEHLRSICAFTMPQLPSYDRIVESHGADGQWVAWGTQNRECPLRGISANRWEVRCLDGTANMYLAMGAVIGAGSLGVDLRMDLGFKDCQRIFQHRMGLVRRQVNRCLENPQKMTAEERAKHGIKKRLPHSIDEALTILEQDVRLNTRMGTEMVKDYIVMKRHEQRKLKNMKKDEAHAWLVERY